MKNNPVVTVGSIVGNLVPSEAVTITHIRPLGNSVSVKFTRVNSKKQSSKVLSKEQFEAVEE